MLIPLARLGYASKAFIYGLIGLLAITAALNRGGNVTDTRGALRVILQQPFGIALMWLLAAGLCGYAVWRLLDAMLDPDRHGTDFGGLVERIGNVVRGLIYGGLGLEAFRLAQGLRASGGGDAEARLWTAQVLAWPLGEWLVALAGCIVGAYGVSQIVGAARHSHDDKLNVSAIPAARRGLLLKISRFGVAARAVIIVTVGVFLVRAATQSDAGEVHGVRESVLELASMDSGGLVLGAIAVGLMAYALDQALHAKYRRIRSPV